MDEGTRQWLTKIEGDLKDLNNMTIEKLSSIGTKLDIYLPRQTDHENRINVLEDEVAEIRSDAKAKHRNQTMLIAVGGVVAVILGVLIDHYLLK